MCVYVLNCLDAVCYQTWGHLKILEDHSIT